jgi:spectrin beta
LNHEWAELREKAEAKRDELNSAHGVQTFHIECRETLSWIEDKKRILQSTDSLEMDLTGIMTLQVSYTFLSVHIDNFIDELYFLPYIE